MCHLILMLGSLLILSDRRAPRAYGIFAGQDASRGMALNDTDESVLASPSTEKDNLSDLKPDEIESLEHWLEFFESKYNHVGFLV